MIKYSRSALFLSMITLLFIHACTARKVTGEESRNKKITGVEEVYRSFTEPGYAEEKRKEEARSCDIDSLIRELESDETSSRFTAAQVLGDRKDERAVEPLIKLLSDKVQHVRFMAAWALGEIGDYRAVDGLILLLATDEDRENKIVSYQALAKITDQDFGEDAQAWRAWWEENKGKYLDE